MVDAKCRIDSIKMLFPALTMTNDLKFGKHY